MLQECILRSFRVYVVNRVESTADDHLTVDGDANVCAGAKQKVSAMSAEAIGSWS